jgi:hypothetical protein
MASFDTNATTRSENTQRAQQSRQYSADQHHSLQRIFHALSQGAFDGRTIVFDGDSLTRQLFISLSCLVHSAGYIQDDTKDIDVHWTDKEIRWGLIPSLYWTGPHTDFEYAKVSFMGSGKTRSGAGTGTGTLVYTHHVSPTKLREEWLEACHQGEPIRAFYDDELSGKVKEERIDLNSRDVVVLSAGVHVAHNERTWYMKVYQDLFKCYSKQVLTGNLTSWPKMVYHMTPMQHFWTKNGECSDGFEELHVSLYPYCMIVLVSFHLMS